MANVAQWSVNDVQMWLKEVKYDAYGEHFSKHGINGRALIMLDEADIKQLVNNIGDRKNLYFQIRALRNKYKCDPRDEQRSVSRQNSVTENENNNNMIDSIHKLSGHVCEKCLKKFNVNASDTASGSIVNDRDLKSEKMKTLLSVLYLFLASLWSTFMITVVHDRVPDMQRYPPLPDIILDNVPLMSWAFYWTETIGLVLLSTLLVVLYFHKYRWIILRRVCSLGGTIFLLRSVTMLITSLSVPGIHIQCASQRYGSFVNKLMGAWEILTGGGLAVHGVRTCGDYMFSGHTVWLVLATHFICEYTPYTMNWLHTSVWTMNLFGLFFILAAHEHYSIDVFIAFYITSRMFLYYHSLANNKVLLQKDNRRVKIWFPLYSYFEANIHTQIPNEYEDATPYFIKSVFRRILPRRMFKNNKNE